MYRCPNCFGKSQSESQNNGMPEPHQTAVIHKQWDFETDVLCVGYGGAGAVAAITAHDAGAEVDRDAQTYIC